MKQWMAHLAIVLTVAAVILFTNLGSARLWDRDEPRNAGCAREMLARGDWVTPMFNDELRDAKPVLLYWLIMSAYSMFGENEFAARFWSALLACGSVAMTFAMGRRLFGRDAGLWAGLALCSSLMFVVAGRAATPDSVLIFCTSAALTCYVLGTFRPATEVSPSADASAGLSFGEAAQSRLVQGRSFPTQWRYIIGMYVMMGLGVLAKGPVGMILPMAVIGMFSLLVRLSPPQENEQDPRGGLSRFLIRIVRPFHPIHFAKTTWSLRPVTATLIVLTIAAPWYIWVGLRTDGDFLNGFFLKEHFGRATQSFENHDGPIFYYPVAILIGFFPWSVFALPVILSIDRTLSRVERSPHRLATLFGVCWVGVYLGVFSIAQTKLPSYVTPCYPALALLTGAFVADRPWLRSPRIAGWTRLALAVFALVGVGLVIGIPLVAREFLPGLEWLGAIGLSLILGGTLGWWALRRERGLSARAMFASGAVLFVALLFGLGTIGVDRYQQSDRLLRAVSEHRLTDSPSLASYGVLESSWVFYAERPIYELSAPTAPAGTAPPVGSQVDAARAMFSREHPWTPKPRPELNAFFAATEDPFVIMRKEQLDQVRDQLPDDVEVLAEAEYFLQGETLVIVGRKRSHAEQLAREPSDSMR